MQSSIIRTKLLRYSLLFDAVGFVNWPVKIVPEMTYKVSSETLSLYSQ